ncbi:ATP-binding cassette domain-containing protein, partial [Escherichia coli]|nr:ATP-binding cassette domain-containing protein [Escherichia coli]
MPTDGRIMINGQDITDKGTNIMKVRQDVGMVFQHFHLFPHKTVLQNLTYAPMKVKGVSKSEAEKTGLELLEKVGLSAKAYE